MSVYLSHDTPRPAYVIHSAQTNMNYFPFECNTAFESKNTVLRLDAQAFQPRQRERGARQAVVINK